MVTPLRSESGLRYADWVRGNREYVAESLDSTADPAPEALCFDD